jgi:hypothetical protein
VAVIKLNGEGRLEHVAKLQRLVRLARRASGVTVSDEECRTLIGREDDARRMAGKFGLVCNRTEKGLLFKVAPPKTEEQLRKWWSS